MEASAAAAEARASAAPIIFRTCSAFVTSQTTGSTRHAVIRDAIALAASSTADASASARTTWQPPSTARAVATALPMPEPAPVTHAVRWARRSHDDDDDDMVVDDRE